ncbi:MAG: peptidoglycan D,D-transpeptidase FtsI family protein, partial [[Clostridium] innocuum]
MKRSNRTLAMMMMAMGCITLLILSNVLYTMTSARHFRTGMNVKEYKDGDIVQRVVLKARRGSILDRSGEVLAKDEDTYTVIAILSKTRKDIGNRPAYVQDIDKTARLLAPKLGLEEAFLRKKLEDARDLNMYQTEFGEKGKYLSNSVKESIAALKLPGIEFQSSVKRTYPNSVFASHLLGFAQYDEAKKKISGQIGLEAALDQELSGTNGSKEYQKDADGNPLPGTEYTKDYAKDGDHVVLTLDRNVQQTLQSSLDKSVKKTSGGVRGWGIVMEVKTGKILGWASSPSFHLNSRNDIKDYVDLPSDFLYEPGSVMKGITYAAAVDSGQYPYNKTFDSDVYHFVEDSKGNIHRTNNANDLTIYDAQQSKHGTISFDKGFVLSSNIGICELLANYMEPSTYKEYLEKFGFLKSVDTPYLNNKPGEMQFTYASEKLSTGFGQAINVNALQMAQAFSAIFNDGTMMRPYV